MLKHLFLKTIERAFLVPQKDIYLQVLKEPLLRLGNPFPLQQNRKFLQILNVLYETVQPKK